MKKIFATVTAALAALSFSAILFAAEQDQPQTMPPGHPPIGEKQKPAKHTKKKKSKKAKKAAPKSEKSEKQEEQKPAETPAAK